MPYNNNKNFKILSTNRKAKFNYTLIKNFEAGVALLGPEVKSLRNYGCNIEETYISKSNSGASLDLVNLYLQNYSSQSSELSPYRPRALLLHKKEINYLIKNLDIKGCTIVPLSIYFNHKGLVKVSISLAKGKTSVDKRNTIKNRDLSRLQNKELMRYK